MKTVFIKSGGYYETPGVSVSSAVNEHFDIEVNQFVKTDQSFKLELIGEEIRLYMASHIPGATYVYKIVDLVALCNYIDKYEFAYFGVVVDSSAVLSHAQILDKLTAIVIDKTTNKLIDAVTGMPVTGDNVVPVIYGMKMNDGSSYAMILSQLGRIDNNLANADGTSIVINEEFTVIPVNDGSSVRDQFIDIKFTNVLKHFKNQDLIIGYAAFAKRNQSVSVNIFKDTAAFIDDEFKNGFTIEVDSNFEFSIVDGVVTFETGDVVCVGYMSIKLKATPMYENVSLREIKETLTFDFSISVL